MGGGGWGITRSLSFQGDTIPCARIYNIRKSVIGIRIGRVILPLTAIYL